MTPFRALYGYDSLTFMEGALGDSRAPMARDWIQESREILRELKDHSHKAQNQQNLYADKNRVEHSFEVGTWYICDCNHIDRYPSKGMVCKN
jgi:hypothetical protein